MFRCYIERYGVSLRIQSEYGHFSCNSNDNEFISTVDAVGTSDSRDLVDSLVSTISTISTIKR